MERTVKAKLASLFLAPVYIVLVSESDGRRLSLRVTPVMLQIGLVLAVGALIACVMALNVIGTHYDGAIASASKFDAWETTIQEQRTELDTLRRESYLDIESVLTWAESLQEGLASIESLGTRMFEETGIEADDFDIQRSRIGGIGGPVLQGADGDDAPPVAPGELESTVASLEGMRATLEVRERQLSVLRALVLGASSERIEDVVTFAGRDRSYGNYVEISHGDGLKTLYAHAGNIHVVPGDVVEKGQVIGEVGDTGRSTGPHVHYEVIHDGKRLNPWRFVHSS